MKLLFIFIARIGGEQRARGKTFFKGNLFNFNNLITTHNLRSLWPFSFSLPSPYTIRRPVLSTSSSCYLSIYNFYGVVEGVKRMRPSKTLSLVTVILSCKRTVLTSLRSGKAYHRRRRRQQRDGRKDIRTNQKIYCSLMVTVILNASIKSDYLCRKRVLSKIQLLPAQNVWCEYEAWGNHSSFYKKNITLIFAEWFHFKGSVLRFFPSFPPSRFFYFIFFCISLFF